MEASAMPANMSDPSTITHLPLEILGEIAAYACHHEYPVKARFAAQNLRLVCRQLSVAASPFLMTAIWGFLQRRDLKKLFEVSHHPIISKRITIINYDSAVYEEVFNDPTFYQKALGSTITHLMSTTEAICATALMPVTEPPIH